LQNGPIAALQIAQNDALVGKPNLAMRSRYAWIDHDDVTARSLTDNHWLEAERRRGAPSVRQSGDDLKVGKAKRPTFVGVGESEQGIPLGRHPY
jgi:hypothetical protein